MGVVYRRKTRGRAGWLHCYSFPDQFSNEAVSLFSASADIPPAKSAIHHLALTTSLAYIGEWNGVSQAQSAAE